MFIHFGHYCLILLFLLNIFSVSTPFFNYTVVFFKKNLLIKLTSIQFILAILTTTCIVYSYIISDYSVLNIKNNAHSTIPLLFKFTSLWSNHEGSILLWIFLLSLNNYIVMNLNINISINFLYKFFILGSYVSLFFSFFTIYTSNPYISLYIYHLNGSELNPILQDVILAIHPPLIYLGYIGCSISYFLTSVALIEKEYSDIIKKYINISILVSWCLLTIGILLGSFWSYYELGWGGWWFWDPVENAALLPWLLMSITIHTIKDDSFIYWTFFICLFIFIFSLLATFFVRSGILISVHSSALDYHRGYLIFGFIFLITLFSIVLFFKNIKTIYKYTYYKYYSYNDIIMINSILITVIFITVLIGTVLPTLFSYFTEITLSIGISFYNYILIPILIPFLFMMIKINNINNFNNLLFKLGSLLPIILLFFFYDTERNYTSIILIILLILLLCSLYIYTHRLVDIMVIAHLGVFIFLFGIIISNLFYLEAVSVLFPGNEITLNSYIYSLRDINYIIAPNYYSLYGNIAVINTDNDITVLFPEKRYYFIKGIYVTKSSIYTNYFSDLYSIIGDGNFFSGYYMKYSYRSLMSFIWIGPLFFVMSAIYSLYNHFTLLNKKLLLWK